MRNKIFKCIGGLLAVSFLFTLVATPRFSFAAENGGVKPGSFFYALDIFFEKIDLTFTFNKKNRVLKIMNNSEERLSEAENAISQNQPNMAKKALDRYQKDISSAYIEAQKIDNEEKKGNLISFIDKETSKHVEKLNSVYEKAPEASKEAIKEAIEVSEDVTPSSEMSTPKLTSTRTTPKSTNKNLINVVLDMHSHEDFITEVVSGSSSLIERKNTFLKQLNNIEWLFGLGDKYGTKISFLSVAPWAELCVDNIKNGGKCGSLVKRLYESGGIIGFHSHNYKYSGSFNEWEAARGYKEEQVVEYMKENINFVNDMIKEVLGISNDNEVEEVNSAIGTPDISDEQKSKLGFMMKEGGEDQNFLPYFGQVPYQPFRPSTSSPLKENLNGVLVTLPEYPIFGPKGSKHFGVKVDPTLEHQKAMFLQLYLNWRESGEDEDKVWVYSNGSHLHDWDDGNKENRERLENFHKWIYDNFVKTGVAKFAGYESVYDEYIEWEKNNQGKSSFNYELDYTDYNEYPYMEFVNKYLKNSVIVEDIEIGDEANAFVAKVGDKYDLVLAYSNKGDDTLNLSKYFEDSSIQRIFLDTGEKDTVKTSAIFLNSRPIVLCEKNVCDSILNYDGGTTTNKGETTTGTDSGFGSTGKCGDGTCAGPENSTNCSIDCVSKMEGGSSINGGGVGGYCGDGICGQVEKEKGVCPVDCK